MSDKQYVWHKSCQENGEGHKWELLEHTPINRMLYSQWCVYSMDRTTRHFLPRSEYVLCPAPERWERVVVEARREGGNGVWNLYEIGAAEEFGCVRLEAAGIDYRLKSIDIERKVPS